ncbi:unnamed protein product, partial [Closterium sp. NIES-64]
MANFTTNLMGNTDFLAQSRVDQIGGGSAGMRDTGGEAEAGEGLAESGSAAERGEAEERMGERLASEIETGRELLGKRGVSGGEGGMKQEGGLKKGEGVSEEELERKRRMREKKRRRVQEKKEKARQERVLGETEAAAEARHQAIEGLLSAAFSALCTRLKPPQDASICSQRVLPERALEPALQRDVWLSEGSRLHLGLQETGEDARFVLPPQSR